jgi:hypothetical protein
LYPVYIYVYVCTYQGRKEGGHAIKKGAMEGSKMREERHKGRKNGRKEAEGRKAQRKEDEGIKEKGERKEKEGG